jgi:hypothetical protein
MDIFLLLAVVYDGWAETTTPAPYCVARRLLAGAIQHRSTLCNPRATGHSRFLSSQSAARRHLAEEHAGKLYRGDENLASA